MKEQEINEQKLDDRIERVVKSVASKKAEMARWEAEYNNQQRRVATKRWSIYGISAAACVAVAVGVGIHFLTVPQNSTSIPGVSTEVIYRGGSSELEEIATLINSHKEGEALVRIDSLMGDTILAPDMSEQRREYLREVQAVQQYELEWFKINALVNLGEKEDATKLLKSYVKKDGEHKGEAEKLLKGLTK